MATKLYFHAAASTVSGTLPASNVSVSATSPTQIGDGSNHTMNRTIGASQTSSAITTNGTANAQPSLIVRFVSDRLAAQTFALTSVGDISLGIAGSEGNAGSNFQVRISLATWRPSTGAVVTRIHDLATNATLEPGTSETSLTATNAAGGTSATVADGDILICEIWRDSTVPGASTARLNTVFYDGTTEASTTSNAAFINFPNDTLVFAPQVFGQAQADILVTSRVYAQGQADIEATANAYGQGNADILVTTNCYGQAQAQIKAFGINGFAQANSDILVTVRGYGQGQADILQTYNGFAQGQADILHTYNAFAQSQADIKSITQAYGQTQADILQVYQGYSQAQGDILAVSQAYGQAQADILVTRNGFGQANADIDKTSQAYGQAQASILQTYQGYGQAQGTLPGGGGPVSTGSVGIFDPEVYGGEMNSETQFDTDVYGILQDSVLSSTTVYGQAQAFILQPHPCVVGQSQASILATSRGYGQAQGFLKKAEYAQAQAYIFQPHPCVYAQAQAQIKAITRLTQETVEVIEYSTDLKGRVTQDTVEVVEQSTDLKGRVTQDIVEVTESSTSLTGRVTQAVIEVVIFVIPQGYGQANAFILSATKNACGQAQGDIKQTYQVYGQAQADIKQTYQAYGQAQGKITNTSNGYGQAQALIIPTRVYAQAQGDIKQTYQAYGQTQADIKQVYQGYGQAQGNIVIAYQAYGQSQADILAKSNGYGQVQGDIKQTYQAYAQSQADIKQTYQGYGQSQAQIIETFQGYGQAQADIKSISYGFGQANADIVAKTYSFAQAHASIRITRNGYGQSQGSIAASSFRAGYGQAQADIQRTDYRLAQTLALIDSPIKIKSANSQALIVKSAGYGQAVAFTFQPKAYSWAQAQAKTKRLYRVSACAMAFIRNKKMHGHAMADIKKATRAPALALGFIIRPQAFGQAKAYISPATGSVYAQANAWIWDGYKLAQAQARILGINPKSAQAQAKIKIYNAEGLGQAQASIIPYGPAFGQAQAKILSAGTIKLGQAQAHILGNTGYAQAQAYMGGHDGLLLYDTFGRIQAFNTTLGTPNYGPAWANSFGDVRSAQVDGSRLDLDYSTAPNLNGDAYVYAHSAINTSNAHAYAEFTSTVNDAYMYLELRTGNVWIQRNMNLNQWQMFAYNAGTFPTAAYSTTAGVTYSMRLWALDTTVKFKIWPTGTAEPEAWLITLTNAGIITFAGWFGIFFDNETPSFNVYYPTGHTYMDNINVEYTGTAQWGQAQASINQPNPCQYGQVQATISQPNPYKFAQAQAMMRPLVGNGQAQADILVITNRYGQAMAHILGNTAYGQAMALIVPITTYAQAQAYISIRTNKYGQALATIFSPWALGQAKARINQTPRKYGQAQGQIRGGTSTTGQSQAYIRPIGRVNAQAQAFVYAKSIKYGQAQAKITNGRAIGQAQADITSAVLQDGTPTYLVAYNGYHLPGYAQEESIESLMETVNVGARFSDIPFTEYLGLQNRTISVRMLVVGDTYLDRKNQIQKAATIVRSKRAGFADFYLHYHDRHFEAINRSIKVEADATETTTSQYNLDFEAKPWIIKDTSTTASGVTFVTTAGRTIDNGGWTPTTVRFTGTNVTVSGYTDNGDFTGYISVSGFVQDMEINTEAYTTTDDSTIIHADYQLYVGPGVTNFSVTGATEITITYHDRWYL